MATIQLFLNGRVLHNAVWGGGVFALRVNITHSIFYLLSSIRGPTCVTRVFPLGGGWMVDLVLRAENRGSTQRRGKYKSLVRSFSGHWR